MAAVVCTTAACTSPTGVDGARADSGTTADASGDGDLASQDPFFLLLALSRATPVPRTPQEQVELSELVLEGHLDDVMDGRIVDYATGAPNPYNTAVFRIKVDREIKGATDGYAYAEFLRGGIPIDRMLELLPRQVPMIFLLRVPTWDAATYKFINPGSGLPEGATLHTFTHPSGIVLESPTQLEYPLGDDPRSKVFESATLEDVAVELEELSAAH